MPLIRDILEIFVVGVTFLVMLPYITNNLISVIFKNDSKDNVNKSYHFILLWDHADFYPFNLLTKGFEMFEKLNCGYQNCYITPDRYLFDGDLSGFNAIAFNGRKLKRHDLPHDRSFQQLYIYFNTESADNNPVCEPSFDDFFNSTATYRLDSDILITYFDIFNNKSDVIGPRADMKWLDSPEEIRHYVDVVNKTKAVAWFVSNCNTRSPRMAFASQLGKALQSHGYFMDVYGSCGALKCTKKNEELCNAMLRKDYYFYFSAENSLSEDYVTEKVLNALLNDVVPIVYGGADYNRFLPPHSFINSRLYTPNELAEVLVKLIKSPEEYEKYFWWKSHYYYKTMTKTRLCSVCELLNRPPRNKSYKNFRRWWNPNFEKRCSLFSAGLRA